MRKAHQILAGLLAVLVIVQAMAIEFALAGLFQWVDKDGGELNKQVLDSWDDNAPSFAWFKGFIVHGIDGMNVIPLLALIGLIVAFFVKDVPGAAKRAAILLGMVILQVVLGLTAHDTYQLAPLHVLNGFGIFVMAGITARKAGEVAPAAA